MELLEVQKEADSASRKAILFGMGALLLAGAFGWMLARLGGGGAESQTVVVAAQEIPPLTIIKREHLRVVPWPRETVPAGTFANPNDLLQPQQINLSSLVVGEPILLSRLSTPERGLGVANLVEPTMRAFVVQVNEATAKSQIIHPDAMVDVVATLEDPKTHEMFTRVILQNVRVLAVGDSIEADPGNKDESGQRAENTAFERHKIVTLLIKLQEVEKLSFAAAEGKIDLALRSKADSEEVSTTGVSGDLILGNRAVPTAEHSSLPASAPAKKPHRAPAPTGPSIYKVRR